MASSSNIKISLNARLRPRGATIIQRPASNQWREIADAREHQERSAPARCTALDSDEETDLQRYLWRDQRVRTDNREFWMRLGHRLGLNGPKGEITMGSHVVFWIVIAGVVGIALALYAWSCGGTLQECWK